MSEKYDAKTLSYVVARYTVYNIYDIYHTYNINMHQWDMLNVNNIY